MNVFDLREHLIQDYFQYASSFINIKNPQIEKQVESTLAENVFWPDPLIQLNPSYARGGSVDDLVNQGLLHPACQTIFQRGKDRGRPTPLNFHRHQTDAIRVARGGHNYILTTGTGSGKSLAYIVPIVDYVLRAGSGQGIRAIIIYPMNALANSQQGELKKFIGDSSLVTVKRYTGQESEAERQQIITHPPDILLTNYVMLELMMTRTREEKLLRSAEGLRFLVLDELHTYRGRQGADVALLVRRVRDRLQRAQPIQCVGTSATLASEGSYAEQRKKIAEVGTQLFGAPVSPEHVISETLQRATPSVEFDSPDICQALRETIHAGEGMQIPTTYREFVQHPLSAWIESTFGIQESEGRLVRNTPISIRGPEGAAHKLAILTEIDETACADCIQRWLLAGYTCEPNPETGFRPFAFRLHQFISPGVNLYATLEPSEQRYLTFNGQQYMPGDRSKHLFPLCFCRECGQEYYSVSLERGEATGRRFVPREFREQTIEGDENRGYLYLNPDLPWPVDTEEIIKRVPEDWVEERANGQQRIKSGYSKRLPQHYNVLPDGRLGSTGEQFTFISTPLAFCLNCGVSYGSRQGEFTKLAVIGAEGRSSATTILSLSAVRTLRATAILPKEARKLLSFTDNRQDASLQAGHFNDFVEIGLLRAAIYRAAHKAGTEGLAHETIAQQVFEALSLPLELYASDPSVKYQALEDTNRALRQVLGYRIYRDLRRGWRITSPNLEQCGLIEITYTDLDEVCRDQGVWANCHPALADSTPEIRSNACRVLLDYMRRELAIKVDYLDKIYQERIQQQSSQRLVAPWAIDEDEPMDYASIVFPRSRTGDDYGGNSYLSARGGVGQYLRRPPTFPTFAGRLTIDDTWRLIREMLEGLRVAGIIEMVVQRRNPSDVGGYQLVASAMRWRAGNGEQGFHDPIRVPRQSNEGTRPNRFFVNFYREMANSLVGLEAREHTAQVPNKDREEREDDFRNGDLPVLYCSPTMELGVDIAELNVVNMRNVPPTPANYAQRSGRAGRSGQPALVFTYCSGGNAHDQYFFRRPDRMVAGAVQPPRLDLTNADLLRAHIHAIWLAETRASLYNSLRDVLEVGDAAAELPIRPDLRHQLESEFAARRARNRAVAILKDILPPQEVEKLVDATLNAALQSFDAACNRWRELYLAALSQRDLQDRIIRDASRSASDKRLADRLRREAEAQLQLLLEVDNATQSDFYSYRYFATEGFLPGYSFPRLPISAFIPARRTRQRDEFLSRPRFLAISEFGPRAIIYHEGSRYLIHQVIMPMSGESNDPITRQAKQCRACGYLHPITPDRNDDVCQRCKTPLNDIITPLLHMQNVVTRRRDRISSDEEERLRMGYEIRTGVRFAQKDGQQVARTAQLLHGDTPLAALTYAPAATLWRINLGWSRRKNREEHGFVLDLERGYWARNEANEDDPANPTSGRTRRVIPYVEDSRNCLLLEPASDLRLDEAVMATLQAALKRAIETVFQLEDNELYAEPLPDFRDRRLILFYEAAEGGAGVLRRLVEEPDALRRVASQALELCHYDPATGTDLRRAQRSREDCEAACYDCLMSYGNQREHPLLDRKKAKNTLMQLMTAQISTSPTIEAREVHVERLRRLCDSDLERDWLALIDQRGLRLPDAAQVLFEDCSTRVDFYYRDAHTVIMIDGSPHDSPRRQVIDQRQTDCLEDSGLSVIRFGYRDNWETIIRQHRAIFGEGR